MGTLRLPSASKSFCSRWIDQTLLLDKERQQQLLWTTSHDRPLCAALLDTQKKFTTEKPQDIEQSHTLPSKEHIPLSFLVQQTLKGGILCVLLPKLFCSD